VGGWLGTLKIATTWRVLLNYYDCYWVGIKLQEFYYYNDSVTAAITVETHYNETHHSEQV